MISPAIKSDFPIFNRLINGKPLVYLDNASTTQKPRAVINALKNYYETMNANIHRGIHTLSEEATEAYEATRRTVANFINAEYEEIIFTRNTTEAINLVMQSWGKINISEGDEIAVSPLEHHSNLVPWQELCREKGAALKVIEDFSKPFSEKTKLVAITQVSNVLGTMLPIKEIIRRGRAVNAKVLIDAAQSAPHMPINVKDLDGDFLTFSSHKMLGPTGVGVLYGKKHLLEQMPPFLFGGDMVLEVTQFEASWNRSPWKFEAGTPNIADTIAFKTAIEYLQNIGMANIQAHEEELTSYALEKISELDFVTVYGHQPHGIISFNIHGVHAHDVASIFNSENIAIRSGHHCCMPLMKRLDVPATARMSFYFYNTKEDIDAAIEAMKKVQKIFHPHNYGSLRREHSRPLSISA